MDLHNLHNSDDEDLMEDLKGKILNGKYLLISVLGSGSYAVIWLVMNIQNIQSPEFFALKIQNMDDYDTGLDEIDIMRKLNKEGKNSYVNILVDNFIYETEDGSHVCMVFELMRGSLYDIIKNDKQCLSFDTVRIIIRQLLIALDIMNSKYKLLHTDIKPDNILVVGISDKVRAQIDIVKSNKVLIDKIKKGNKNRRKYDTDSIIKCVDNMKLDDIKYDVKNVALSTNIQTKLADFGTCKDINYTYYDIQTRYYRAPEIILGYEYNGKCDMWSVGCMIYELLTGQTLFCPYKDIRFNTDRFHIYEMNSVLGKIPDYLINKSLKKTDFYKKNGLLKGVQFITYKPLHKTITSQLETRKDMNTTNISLTIDLIYNLLSYDPETRLSAKLALNHEWFK